MFFWTWSQNGIEKLKTTGLEANFGKRHIMVNNIKYRGIGENAETAHGKHLQYSPSCKKCLKVWNIWRSCKNCQMFELSEIFKWYCHCICSSFTQKRCTEKGTKGLGNSDTNGKEEAGQECSQSKIALHAPLTLSITLSFGGTKTYKIWRVVGTLCFWISLSWSSILSSTGWLFLSVNYSVQIKRLPYPYWILPSVWEVLLKIYFRFMHKKCENWERPWHVIHSLNKIFESWSWCRRPHFYVSSCLTNRQCVKVMSGATSLFQSKC